jgi:hypothetical protein
VYGETMAISVRLTDCGWSGHETARHAQSASSATALVYRAAPASRNQYTCVLSGWLCPAINSCVMHLAW